MRFGFSHSVAMAWALLVSAATPQGAAADEPARPVPLGGTLIGQLGDRFYGVYVPTRHGGTLTITASDGAVEAIIGPDGRPRSNGQELGGLGAHGWYTFRISGTAPGRRYTVSTAFEQVGRGQALVHQQPGPEQERRHQRRRQHALHWAASRVAARGGGDGSRGADNSMRS